jgi:AraC-like DNA-binding protein
METWVVAISKRAWGVTVSIVFQARCRRDLLDPALRDRPVSAIAARWGITDPAHFSRLFRATYGVPPSEYRDLGLPWTLARRRTPESCTNRQRLCARSQRHRSGPPRDWDACRPPEGKGSHALDQAHGRGAGS